MNSPTQAENTNNYIEYFPKHHLKVARGLLSECGDRDTLRTRLHSKLVIMDLQQ
jgi:hypothetical protein